MINESVLLTIESIKQTPIATIIRVIGLLNEKSRFKDSFSGGNCGMYSLALARILKEKYNIDVKFGIMFRDDFKMDKTDSVIGKTTGESLINDLSDLVNDEQDVYHVFIEYGKNYFDEIGKINANYLLKMALDQYDDYNPGSFMSIGNDELGILKKVIINQTDFSIDEETFYKDFKRILK